MRLALIIFFIAQISVASELIDLHFYLRPPYMVKDNESGARGLAADPARAAFEKAGIKFRWQMTPAKRQLAKIENNRGLDCGIGWYKTAEREKFGKFTNPIYQDKPTVAIARAGFQPKSKRLATLAADPKIRILMKNGLTYGQNVVKILAQAKAHIENVTIEQPDLARMLLADRADFMFSSQEEVDLILSNVEQTKEKLKILSFSDVQEGESRHIMCSQKVSDQTIKKINQALSQLGYPINRARSLPPEPAQALSSNP